MLFMTKLEGNMKRYVILGVILATLCGLAVIPKQTEATPSLIRQTNTYIGSTADTSTVTSALSGSVYITTDTKKTYISDGTSWILKEICTVSAIDTLSTPGNFPAYDTAGYTHATVVFWDSLVTTSATVQFQGYTASRAPLSWYTLDATDDSTVYTGTSGTWARTFTLAGGINKIRQKVLSEAGSVTGLFKSVIILWNQYK